jgi:hypothetical protein
VRARARVTLLEDAEATLGGWSIWGPDGHELGASGSVRIEFNYKAKNGAK